MEKIEAHEEQYQIFQDDSRVIVDEDDSEPIERMMKHKYDKFKYVSPDFLKRNQLKKSNQLTKKTSKSSQVKQSHLSSSDRKAKVSVSLQTSPTKSSKLSKRIDSSPSKDVKESSRAYDILERLADVKIAKSNIQDRISPERAESILRRISEGSGRSPISSGDAPTESKKRSKQK